MHIHEPKMANEIYVPVLSFSWDAYITSSICFTGINTGIHMS